MTQTHVVPGVFNGPRLMTELLGAFPHWLAGQGDERHCRLTVETTPTQARVTFPADQPPRPVLDIIAAHDPTAATDDDRLRARLRLAAASAAGQRLEDLGPAELPALLALLLYRAGGLDPEGRVRPYAEWL